MKTLTVQEKKNFLLRCYDLQQKYIELPTTTIVASEIGNLFAGRVPLHAWDCEEFRIAILVLSSYLVELSVRPRDVVEKQIERELFQMHFWADLIVEERIAS